MRPDANKTQLPPRQAAILEVAKLGIGDVDDIRHALKHHSSDEDGCTIVTVEIMERALKAEAENESLKARLEKWESRVSSDELSRHLDHGMNCGSKGFDGYDRGSCTCGLIYRIQVQTEQNLRTAWTKRAEEAEAEHESLTAQYEELRQARQNLGNDLAEVLDAGIELDEAQGIYKNVRAEKAEVERDQALEVIREYRQLHSKELGCFGGFNELSSVLYADKRCPTCIKADALLSKEETK